VLFTSKVLCKIFEYIQYYMYKLSLFAGILLVSQLTQAKTADPLLSTLMHSPTERQVQLLSNFGYRCDDRWPTSCTQGALVVQVNSTGTYAPCASFGLCGATSAQNLKALMRGEPRQINHLVVTEGNDSVRWVCISPSSKQGRLCIQS
jgi:hypothetical protein